MSLRLIESSLGSVATKLNFFIHNLAQMKFASSEDRPTLSFAPRVHTAKSDGLIRNLYICRHIRTASSSKGYVSPHVFYLPADSFKTSCFHYVVVQTGGMKICDLIRTSFEYLNMRYQRRNNCLNVSKQLLNRCNSTGVFVCVSVCVCVCVSGLCGEGGA